MSTIEIKLTRAEAESLADFLAKLRPGDYRDMTDSGEAAYSAWQSVKNVREALAQALEKPRA